MLGLRGQIKHDQNSTEILELYECGLKKIQIKLFPPSLSSSYIRISQIILPRKTDSSTCEKIKRQYIL
jgi:hypothetical protein